jgi:CxxC motif-containing protein (DUF1111 family)
MPLPRHPVCAAPALGRMAALALAAGAVALCGAWRATAGEEPGLDAGDRFRLALGHAVFRKSWVSAPSSTTSSDGLGPLYNARSCAQCHPQGGRGQPEPSGDLPSALVLRLAVPARTSVEQALLAGRRAGSLPEPVYGRQLQPFAIQGHRSEGRLEVSYDKAPVALDDGEIVRVREPSYRIVNLGHGPLRKDVTTSARVAPALIGLGLIEMVPEEQILAWEGRASAGDGVRGVASRVWSKERGKVVLGRFGWKAGVASVREQVALAFSLDLGISSSLFDQPAGDCTTPQEECRQAPHGGRGPHGGYELADTLLDLVTFYVANAVVPTHPPAITGATAEGEALFHGAGCGACHRPGFVTGETGGPAHFRGREIRPYTDLLLHDMGDDLADGHSEGLADGRMWRTAPLWGAGRAQTPDGRQTYLHDGRARSIDEAVLWHGGEARAAREAFTRLSAGERRALVAFVKSL